MTIASSTRKAGPFAGDGASTIFAFSFKVFSAADLYVVKAATATGAETVLTLTTDYTVSLNADQNNSPGGTVTLTSVLASGYTLTLTSSVGYLQPTDLTNQGGFYPQVITTALDRLTILAQQLKEKLDRAVVVPVSSTLAVDDLTADIITLADDVANIDTVAGISTDVSTLAGISTDVTAAVANITSISNFADIYYGPSATAPTTRKDGSALQEGDLYFDTATNLMRVRTAVSGWRNAQTPVPTTITTQTFSGTGSQVNFTLSSAPAFLTALEVAVAGAVKVPTTDYTLSGTTLTFTSAPTSGTDNIFCRWYSAYLAGVPNDGSVTAAKLAPGAVESVTNPRIGSSGAASYRNKLHNASFRVNQRGVGEAGTLSAGSYVCDRWKAGSSGCTFTTSLSKGLTAYTITAGSLVQTIEGTDLPVGVDNTVCLSWGGTCQGKIGSGSYGASGVTGLATGGTNISVEFSTGTLYQPQLEIGSAASQFEYVSYPEDFARCYYYLPSLSSPTSANAVVLCGGYSNSTSGFVALVDFGLPVRGKPTGVTVAGSFVVNVGSSSANVSSLNFNNATSEHCGILTAVLATTVPSGQPGDLHFVAGSYSKILFTGLEI